MYTSIYLYLSMYVYLPVYLSIYLYLSISICIIYRVNPNNKTSWLVDVTPWLVAGASVLDTPEGWQTGVRKRFSG